MSREKTKERCASCIAWQPGDSWISNASGVYADGTCKNTGKRVANVHHACKFYDKDPHQGVIICMDAEAAYKALTIMEEEAQRA